MTTLTVRSPSNHPEGGPRPSRPASQRAEEAKACGGAPVLDLALCLILAVTVVGLLLLAL